MDIKKLLGKRIQEIRKSKKLTQEKVAELINIETTSLSSIENGRYYPTADNLEKILKVFDISLQELFVTEHLNEPEILKAQINKMLNENPDKLQDIYKIIKALLS